MIGFADRMLRRYDELLDQRKASDDSDRRCPRVDRDTPRTSYPTVLDNPVTGVAFARLPGKAQRY